MRHDSLLLFGEHLLVAFLEGLLAPVLEQLLVELPIAAEPLAAVSEAFFLKKFILSTGRGAHDV